MGKDERKKKKKKRESELDPEIIAHAKDLSRMWLVWRAKSLFIVYLKSPTGERHERRRGQTSGSTAGGRGFCCGMTWHKACLNSERVHTHTHTHSWN